MTNKENMTAAEMLYAARTNSRKPRELPVIAKKLCIREDFLEALETGNYSALAENVYILGFARNYAIELGLDPAVISKKLKEELGITSIEIPPETPNDTNAAPKDAPVVSSGQVPVEEQIDPTESAFYRQNSSKKKLSLLAALIVIIIAGGATMFLMSDRSGSITTGAEVVAEEDSTATKIEFSLPVKFEYAAENRESARIVMQAVAETWVKVERNGEILFSRVLMPGDVYFVPNRPGARATIGNAGGLDIWVGGKLAPKLGAMHTRVTNIPLTEESLLSKRTPRPAVAPAPEPAIIVE